MRQSFQDWAQPKIEHNKLTQWNWMVAHPQNLELGKYVDIGAFTYINAAHGITIEDEVQIGSHCSVYTESTIDGTKGSIKIGKNARIGTHSTIMPGVEIGENAIIGAHSFVKKNVPANSTVFGVPVK
jgi:acetyltransferase-like isoleucine patch superfamily enzyme